MLTKDNAICIRTVDYSETSQVATFFCRATGKIDVIAKGSKRPKSAIGGPLEIFATGQIMFSAKEDAKLATLTEFEPQPILSRLSNNLLSLNCSLFAAELLGSLMDDYDPHQELFDYFLQFLGNIQDCPDRRQAIGLLIVFQLTLLREIGIQPVLNRCANCKTQFAQRTKHYEVYFSSVANGLICKDCEANFTDKIRLTREAANCLTDLKLIGKADEKTLNEIEKILVYHFTALLHRQPKMAKYVLAKI